MGLLRSKDESGFTLVELGISIIVLGILAVGFFGLYTALVNNATLVKRRAVALNLATNQMEYLKSLSYDSLAVAGGSIYSANPLPATKTQKINGATYTIQTSVNYVDDAYDGCGSYPTQALKELYCRNYPPPSGAPSTDQNPADYKIVHVSVFSASNVKLAEVDTQVSARVAETSSNTGALFAKVVDNNGSPVSGATITVVNTHLSPNINLSDSTDSNGVAIFYNLPPDTTGTHYVITASSTNYSSLSTISQSGSLQPTYPSQNILVQQSSFVTLTIKLQGQPSLLVETTDVNGNALPNAKVYIKGGYKKYTSAADTSYYYDNMSPSDSRPTTDASGLTAISNLVPGDYIFCGDSGSTSCSVGGTTYYLAASVPYSGVNPLNPITVPTYDSSSPPSTTFTYNGNDYLQKVRLMLTTSSSFPRVKTLSPDDASQSGGSISEFSFQVAGANLPCNNNPANCSTVVKFVQGASTFTASCTGNSGGQQLNCTVDLSAASQGATQLSVTANGFTLTLPASPLLGGVNVTP
jgi:type II secretory pathway pseudopilin PulG